MKRSWKSMSSRSLAAALRSSGPPELVGRHAPADLDALSHPPRATNTHHAPGLSFFYRTVASMAPSCRCPWGIFGARDRDRCQWVTAGLGGQRLSRDSFSRPGSQGDVIHRPRGGRRRMSALAAWRKACSFRSPGAVRDALRTRRSTRQPLLCGRVRLDKHGALCSNFRRRMVDEK
jgi:hypothetical protein